MDEQGNPLDYATPDDKPPFPSGQFWLIAMVVILLLLACLLRWMAVP